MLELPGRDETLSTILLFMLLMSHDVLAGCCFGLVVIKADMFIIVHTSFVILHSDISLKTSGLGHNAARELVKKRRHSNTNDCCRLFWSYFAHHFINRKIRIPTSYKQEFETVVA